MAEVLSLAAANLLSPMVLFFALGAGAAFLRSDLEVPEAIARGLALYLMLAIGFKGGAAMAKQTLDASMAAALLGAILLSFLMPVLAYGLLRATTSLSSLNAAAVSAHYGSVSVVTFVTAAQYLGDRGIVYEGYLIAMMALMETPAIVTGLWLARRGDVGGGSLRNAWREILLNGSIVLLVGGFAIGWITGEKGMATVAPFIDAPFKGVLCLFLLDMGLLAARRLRGARALSGTLIAFGFYMPLIGAGLGAIGAWMVGLGVGSIALAATLAASASYIAVPAALRLALPKADPAISITLSLAITFPFNVVLGIPLYHALAAWLVQP